MSGRGADTEDDAPQPVETGPDHFPGPPCLVAVTAPDILQVIVVGRRPRPAPAPPVAPLPGRAGRSRRPRIRPAPVPAAGPARRRWRHPRELSVVRTSCAPRAHRGAVVRAPCANHPP